MIAASAVCGRVALEPASPPRIIEQSQRILVYPAGA
jgi:hypothetical protein